MTAGWTGTREEKVAHEFDWHRLAGMIDKPFDSHANLQKMDLTGDAEWCPPIMVPANLPEFRSGLRLDGKVMYLELDPRDGFRL